MIEIEWREAAQFAAASWALLFVVFWGCICFYQVVVPRIDALAKYRIAWKPQPHPSRERLVMVMRATLFDQLVLRPPLLLLLHPLAAWCGVGFERGAAPPCARMLWHFALMMQIDDGLFYWAHRALHHRALYKRFHKRHHEFAHAVPLAAEWSHPVEDMFCNTLATLAGPLLLRVHVTELWLYVACKLWQSIDAHSGYDLPFPISPWSAIRGMDCAPAHDFHHSHNVGNYGGFFNFWDRLCGTDDKYVRHVRKHFHDANANARGMRGPVGRTYHRTYLSSVPRTRAGAPAATARPPPTH